MSEDNKTVAVGAASATADSAEFRRQYGAALGKALRQAQDEPVTPSDYDLAVETYRQLLYDDPLVSAAGCRALANALVQSREEPSKRPTARQKQAQQPQAVLALSDYLVEGIRQVTFKIQQDRPPTLTPTNTTTDPTSSSSQSSLPPPLNDPEPLFVSPTTMTTTSASQEADSSSSSEAAAAAVLAWIVFGRIPLQCCLSSTIETAALYLGSYSGGKNNNLPETERIQQPPFPNPDTETNVERDPVNPIINGHANTTVVDGLPWNGNGHLPVDTENGVRDEEEEDEVWAAESDPSDFVFVSDYDAAQHLQELELWATAMEQARDPIFLSRPSSAAAAPSKPGQQQQPQQQQQPSWADIAGSVERLLRDCNFSKISGMTRSDWKRCKVSEHLTQFSLLLLTSSSSSSSTSTPILQHVPNALNIQSSSSSSSTAVAPAVAAFWHVTGLQPLHLFRDAVYHWISTLSSTATADHNNDKESTLQILQEYLLLLQTLLQVQHATSTAGAATDLNDETIAPATWVGLSCLSALASHVLELPVSNHSQTKRFHAECLHQVAVAIQESSDDLALLLEKSFSTLQRTEQQHKSKPVSQQPSTIGNTTEPTTTTATIDDDKVKDDNDNTTNTAAAIQWTYLSLFQVLTVSINSRSTLHQQQQQQQKAAQVLLNSGLFRQWLLWYEKTVLSIAADTDKDDPALKILLERSLFSLVLSSPTLLGKYAWRFPGLASNVGTLKMIPSQQQPGHEEQQQQQRDHSPSNFVLVVDHFLWNLLGIHLAEQAGTTPTPTIQWKTSNKKSSEIRSPPSWNECREAAWQSLQSVCHQVKAILTDWKTRREGNIDTNPARLSEQQRLLAEFGRLVNQVVESYLLLDLIAHKLATPTEARQSKVMVRELFEPIQQVLAQWPLTVRSDTENAAAKEKMQNEGDSDNDDDENEAVRSKARVSLVARPQLQDEAVNQVRRSLKVFFSALDSVGPQQGTSFEGNNTSIPISFSSKAD